MKRHMKVKSVGQWAVQKQQGGRKTHIKGSRKRWTLSASRWRTDQHLQGSAPVSSDPGSGVTWQASWDVQSSTLGCLGFWVFCARTVTFLYQLLPTDSLLAAEGSLVRPKQPHGGHSCTGAVLPGTQGEKSEMSLVPSAYSCRDSSTYGLSWEYLWKAFLLAFFWLLITTWLVLPPQPHYRATLWSRSGNQFSATHLEQNTCFLPLEMEEQ